MTDQHIKINIRRGILEKAHISGLFKYLKGTRMLRCKVRKKTNRETYIIILWSGEFCSATQHMSVFQQPRDRGFTLIEILIAIFILGLVLATVYASYSGILKTSHQMEEEGNIYKMARTSMDRMIKDLSSLQSSSGSFDFHAGEKH